MADILEFCQGLQKVTFKPGAVMLPEGERLVTAMTRGASAVATGLSARGTKTVDTYSLSGFSDALAKIHSACNM